MKAQLIKFRKDKISMLAFFGILAVMFSFVFMIMEFAASDTSFVYSGGEETVFMLTAYQLMAQFFLYIFTAQACGADFVDKTCNYEIMSGHTRREVYFGRVIPTVILSTLGTMFLIAAPIAAEVIMLGGWGDKVSFTDMLCRFLLMAFPIARITCEFIFLTFIIKNPYVVMGISYVVCIALGMSVPVNEKTMFVLGMTNINALTVIDSWQSFGLCGDMHYIYETALSADIVIPTILTSVIISGIALFLGYVFFKNDDMH